MTTVLAKATVEDFDRFWEVFSSRGADHRAAHGSRGAQVFRHGDNANEIWVLFDWDHDAYREFLADSTTQEIMRAAGLQGPPESQMLHPVADQPS